jgi:regulator of cell morphogenesis and NO signaling
MAMNNTLVSSAGSPVEPIIADTRMSTIALRSPAHASVLDRHGLDFCCGGNRTLGAACAAAGLDLGQLLTEINAADSARSASAASPVDWNERPLPELVDYIVDTHHLFTRAALDRLEPLMKKVFARHGEHHPELARVGAALARLTADLRPHMAREENVLFPYIRALASRHDASPTPPFGTVRNPVRMMMQQHDQAAELLSWLRDASGGFTAPPDACASYSALYAGLSELRLDLLAHVSLENNVLFPRAIAIEDRLLAARSGQPESTSILFGRSSGPDRPVR